MFRLAAVWILAAGFSFQTRAGTIDGDTTQGWSRVSNLPGKLSSLPAPALNGAIYTIGGNDGSSEKTNVYRYDGTNWTSAAGLPAAHSGLAAAVLSNVIYAAGDYGTNVFQYDGTNWTEVMGLPYYPSTPGVGVLNGALYAVSGGTEFNDVTNVCKFNGTTWTSAAKLPVARERMGCGVLNDNLYIIGGDNGSGAGTTNVYVFDGTNWTVGPALPVGTRSHGVGVLNGVLYVVGGVASGGITTNVFMFDGANWTAGTPLPEAIGAMGMAVLNGALYSVAGSGSSATNAVFRYNDQTTHGVVPSSGSWTGGYPVVITGTNLCNGLLGDVTNVTLCGVSVSSIDSVSGSTQIVVTAGVGTPGSGDVRVYSVTEGESVRANGFMYVGSSITVLGTNMAVIASGEAASTAKGTDFGRRSWGSVLTNTFSITNNGNTNLTISGVTTNGSGASVFSISDFGFSIEAGTVSNFNIRFAPLAAGTYTTAVEIANNSTTTPYIVYLAGSCYTLSTNSGPSSGGTEVTITNGVLGSGTDITNVLVGGVAATIVDQGVNWVRIIMPAHAAGYADIVIQSASQGEASLADAFFYTDPMFNWHTFFGASVRDRAYAIALDAQSNVYITGISKATWNGPSGQSPLHDHSGSGNENVVVLKLDRNGAYQWHTFYGDYYDYGFSITIDDDTNLYITGLSGATWSGPSGESPKHAFAGGGDGGFVLKLDGAGSYQWHTFYGAADASNEGRGITLDASTNLYVAFYSTATWNGPSSESPLHAYSGDADLVVLKLDGAGDYVWHTFYGSTNTDQDQSVALDANTNVYITGYSKSSWDGPSGQSPRHAYAGGWDMVAVKLDSAGAYQWHTFHGSASTNDEGQGLAVDGQTNVYIAGRSAGTWNGDGDVSPLHSYSGGDDIMIVKLDGAGGYQWHTFYGASGANDYGLNVALDRNANVHVVGRSFAAWNGDGDASPMHSYAGNADITVINLNSAGGYRWHTFYGSASADDWGQDIALDQQGHIYFTGFSSATWLGGNGASPLHAYTGDRDLVAVVLSSLRYSMTMLGTNGAAIASGAAASTAKGTDFGSVSNGVVLTNTFAITNSGEVTLSISGVTTNGAGANAFSISDLQFSIAAGGVSNFTVRFAPTNAVTYTAAVEIANNSTSTPYVVYLAGEATKHTQTITFPAIADKIATSTVGLAATAGSGLPVEFDVVSGSAYISGSTNLSFSGAGQVSIKAGQTGNTEYAAAPDVTNTFTVSKADQTITFPAIQNQNVTSVVELTATASSEYEVRFAVISGPGTITITNGPPAVNTPYHHYFLSFTGTGTVLVAASQTGNEMWNAAPNVTNSVVVTNETPAGEGSLTAVIRPAEVIAAGAQWRVDGGAWRTSGAIVTGLTAGSHTVNYSEVAGYTNPVDQAVTISPNQLTAVQGTYRLISGDTAYNPISADYDGDQVADPAICQPATGFWAARFSGIDYQWGRMTRVFGPGGYAPVTADFDGDAKADPGLYNTTNGEWRAMFSNIGYVEDFVANLLGDAGCTAMAADFDGDAKADPTVYNPATGDWKVLLSSGGYLQFTADSLLGRTGFAASAGDIDGDRLADPFVCDMATGQCMALLSSLEYTRVATTEGFLGYPEWLLALADYDGDGLADPAIYDPSTGTLAVRFSSADYQLVIWTEFLKP